MTSDLVVCQRRAVLSAIHDFSFRYKTQLDECLESVADTQHQTVSVFHQVCNSIFDPRVSEYSCNEFSRSVRLVSTGKTSRDHDDLAFSDLAFQFQDRIFQLRGRQVADDMDIRFSTSLFKGSCGVHLAVGTRECRNHDFRPCHPDLRTAGVALCIVKFFNLGSICFFSEVCRPYRENTFQRLLPLSDDHIQIVCFSVDDQPAVICRLTDDLIRGSFQQLVCIFTIRKFQYDRSKLWRQHITIDLYICTDLVADSHLDQRHVKTASADSICCQDLAGLCQLPYLIHILFVNIKVDDSVFIDRSRHNSQRTSCLFHFRGNDFVSIDSGDRERCQRRRHVDIHECS